MRNLKVLGLAFIAMLAMSAVAASAASADDLTAESYPAVLKGKVDTGTTDQFLTTAGTVTCTQPTYSATIAAATTSVTATADYTTDGTCTTAGIPSKIDMNGCTYKFNVGAGTTGDADLVCAAGTEVTVTVTPASGTSPCTIHIPGQSDIAGTVTYKNIGAGTTREITLEAALSGIDYTHTAGTGLAKCTAGGATNGTLTAKALVRGEKDPSGAQVGIFMS